MCVSASVPVPVCLSTNLFAFQLINRLSFSCAQVPAVGGWQSVSSLWLVPLISPSSSPCAQYKVAVQSVHCFLRNGVPAEAAPEKEEAGGGESEASASSADDFLLEVVVVCLSAGGGIYCLPVGACGKHLPRCVPIHFQSEYQETRKVKKNIFLFMSQEKCSIESELFEPDEDIHPLCASSPSLSSISRYHRPRARRRRCLCDGRTISLRRLAAHLVQQFPLLRGHDSHLEVCADSSPLYGQ